MCVCVGGGGGKVQKNECSFLFLLFSGGWGVGIEIFGYVFDVVVFFLGVGMGAFLTYLSWTILDHF